MENTDDIAWKHVPFSSFMEYMELFDDCTCRESNTDLYYNRKDGMKFLIKCHTCQKEIVGVDYVDAMIKWNKLCRSITGYEN